MELELPDGTIVKGLTVEEGAAFLALVQKEKSTRQRQQESAQNHVARVPSEFHTEGVAEPSEAVRLFIQTLAAAGNHGVQNKELAEKLGLATARGLSAIVRAVKLQIQARHKGAKISQYFWKHRTRERGSVWYGHAERFRKIGLV